MASEVYLWPKKYVMVLNCQFLSHHVLVAWRNGHLWHHYLPMHTSCSILLWYWSV